MVKQQKPRPVMTECAGGAGSQIEERPFECPGPSPASGGTGSGRGYHSNLGLTSLQSSCGSPLPSYICSSVHSSDRFYS